MVAFQTHFNQVCWTNNWRLCKTPPFCTCWCLCTSVAEEVCVCVCVCDKTQGKHGLGPESTGQHADTILKCLMWTWVSLSYMLLLTSLSLQFTSDQFRYLWLSIPRRCELHWTPSVTPSPPHACFLTPLLHLCLWSPASGLLVVMYLRPPLSSLSLRTVLSYSEYSFIRSLPPTLSRVHVFHRILAGVCGLLSACGLIWESMLCVWCTVQETGVRAQPVWPGLAEASVSFNWLRVRWEES